MRNRFAPSEGRMEEVLQTLARQQRTLDSIVGMQTELRGLVQQQHQSLQKKIAAFGQPCGDVEPIPQQESTGEGLAEPENNAQSVVPQAPAEQQPNIFRGPKKEEEDARAVPPRRTSVVQPPRTAKEWRKTVQKVLKHPWFDTVLGVLILLNFVLLFVELEWRGHVIEGRLDGVFSLPDRVRAFENAGPVFAALDRVFSALFLIELLGDLFVFGFKDCLKERARILDAFAILVSVTDSFILDPFFRTPRGTGAGFRFLKVLRAFRLLRFLRVLRFMGVCSGLRVLVQTLSKSMGSLVWSMAVVGFLILTSALFMSTIVQDILEDEYTELDPAMRAFLYKYYGGALRCFYTMFEATFSAKWATHFSDQLIWDVSPWFMVFWVFYTVTVNFAVIRVLSALFLKQTLDVAAIDAERIAIAKLKEKEKILETLRKIFKLGDVEGDGVLAKWEFDEMMEKEEVKDMFASLELEAPELHLLFGILSEDDGVVDQEEFLVGALKLKTQVKTVDIIQLLHEMIRIKRNLHEVMGGVVYMDRALHPRNPWQPKALEDHHHAATAEPPAPQGSDMTVRMDGRELKQQKY